MSSVDLSRLFDNPPPARGLRGPSANPENLFYKSDDEARRQVQEMVAPPEKKRTAFDAVDDTITRLFGTNTPNPEEVDAAGVERVKQERQADQALIEARRQELSVPQDRGAGRRLLDSTAGGIASAVGSSAEYLGRQFGIKTLEEVGKKARIDAAALTPEDQNLLEKVATGLGSFLPMAATGIGGGVAAGLATGSRAAALLAGSAIGAATEAPSIGQEAFEGALKNTGNEAVAERQGYKAIAYNLPLSFITNKLGFFSGTGGRIAQTGKTVLTEGAQEGGQKALTNVMGYEPTGQGVSEEALIGGLAGGAVKAVTYQAPSDRPGTPSPTEAPGRAPGAAERPVSDAVDRPEDADLPKVPWMEMHATAQSKPGLLAVLSQDAKTDEERDIISRAIARSEVADQVAQVLQDPQLLADVRSEMQQEQNAPFIEAFKGSLKDYANGMPPAGVFKVPSPDRQQAKSIEELWSNLGYQSQVDAEADQFVAERQARQMQVRKPAAPAPVVEDAPAFDAESELDSATVAPTLSVRKPEQPKPQIDPAERTTPDGDLGEMDESNRSLYESYFSQRGAEVRGIPNPSQRESGMKRVMREMQNVGFTEDEARAIFNGERAQQTVTGQEGTFENVSTSMAAEFGEPVENFRQTKAPRNFQKIGQLFGVNIVAFNYAGKNPAIQARAGRYLRGANGKGTVVLNLTKANDAALFVLGHEVYHDLERRFPEDAKRLAAEIKSYMVNSQYKRYQQFYEQRDQAQKTDGEIAADVMGSMFMERNFWEQLQARNPSLLERVMQVLDMVIQSFKSRAGEFRGPTSEALSKIESVQKMMVEIASKGIEQTASSKGRRGQSVQQPQVADTMSDMEDIPAEPKVTKADEVAYQKVVEHLRNGKDFLAVSVWKGQKLGMKGFGRLEDLILALRAPQPGQEAAPAPRKAEPYSFLRPEDGNAERYEITSPGIAPLKVGQQYTREQMNNLRAEYGDEFKAKPLPSQAAPAPAPAAQAQQADEDTEADTLVSMGSSDGGKKRTVVIERDQKRDSTLLATVNEIGEIVGNVRRVEGMGAQEEFAQAAGTTVAKLEAKQRAENARRLAEAEARAAEREENNRKLRAKQTQLFPQVDTPAMKLLRGRMDAIIKSASSIKFFQDTIVGLEQQITDIDSKLKAMNRAEVDGKVYRVVNEEDESPGLWGTYDENSYDRYEKGFRPDKPSSRQDMLAARRKLTEELTAVRENSIRSKAKLFRQSINRMGDQMMSAVRTAMAGGMPEADARKVFNDYYQAISFRETRAEELAEAVVDLPDADIQGDMFDGLRVAMGFVADFRNKLMTAQELNGFFEQGLRDGDFSFTDIQEAFKAFKLDIPRGVMDVGQQLAMRKTLATHLRESGSTTAARMEWVTSMDKVLQANPGARSRFSESEIALYEKTFALRNTLKSRRKVTEEMAAADTAEDAFPALLFSNYTLAQAGKDKALNKWLEGNGREAWMQDVAYALRSRPDLANDIFRVVGEDRAAFDAWVQQKKDAIARESRILAKAPAFAEIRNMDYAETILTSRPMPESSPEALRASADNRREDGIDQIPSRVGDERILPQRIEIQRQTFPELLDALGNQQNPPPSRLNVPPILRVPESQADTRPGELERLYTTVVNSELNELPSIMDAIAKVRSLLTSRIDLDTGEIFQSQEAAEAAAAEYVDSVYQKSMMTPAARSDLGSRFDPDIGFGMTVEEAGDRDRGLPEQTFETDQSLEELQNAGLVTEADVEGMATLGQEQTTDEEADLEADNSTADEGRAAESRERSPRPVRVPTSLVGTEQYRFRKGFFNGDLVPAVVTEHLAKIASKWNGAPNIQVVPNVQSLPQELREKVLAKLGSNMYAKGLYLNGDVFIFSDHAESLADAEFTLFHEVEGHFGMRAFLGADFDAYLDRLYKTNPEIRREADARMNEEPMGRLEAVDEVLSDMQMDGRNQGLFQAYIGRVVAGLRSIGMERVANWIASKGNFEVAYLLRGAKQAVRRGDRPSVGAPDDLRLAATRTPYELFAAKDGKTVAYARYNPVLDRWSIFTATGPDIRQGFNTAIESDFEKVVSTMRKMGRVERRTRSGVYVDNKIPSDLAKIPDFRILSEDINFTSREGLKNAWALVRRNGAINLQNEYIPVFEVVNHLERQGRINPAYDVRPDLEGNYERRTGSKLEKYREQYEAPLMKLVEQLGKEGGDKTLAEAFPGLINTLKDSRLGNLSLMDAYLGARHAAERNRQIAKINPNQPDGGSGIFTSDADAILNALSRQPYANTLAEMTHLLQQVSALKLKEMYDAGMMGTDELQARSQYQYYVNLSGINENIDQFDNPVVLAGGPKFGTRKDRRAMGRGDAASDILIRTLQSFEAAVIHAEKNKVKQKVLAMFEMNYDPDFVVINKMATVRKLDENGQVTEATDERYIQNRDVMIVHVKGKPITMEFKQKGPGSFAEAINGMIWPPEATGWFQRFSGRANQIMGQMLTTWNPAWTAVNYLRDLQNMYFNSVTEGKITREMALQMVKLQPQAIKAAFHLSTNGKRGSGANQDILDAYNEMRDAGGATSFLNLRGLEYQVEQLEKLMNPAKKGSIKDIGIKLADMMEAINIPMEMAPRIAAYKVMRDNGYSKEEAARFAGDITVNFNMRGSNRFMRNMFLFFNPAVQGANKMYRLAINNPKTMGKIALGMAVTGFMANIIARALGGEDEDGIDKLDSVPVFKRATSIVLFPDTPLGAIPIPYGWNAFYAAGHFMADTLWAGTQSPSTTIKRIVGTAFESFSPLGGSMLDASSTGVGLMKAVTPTVLSPLLDVFIHNENRFGAPIAKQESMFGGGKRADAYMNFDSASPISTAVFRGLNKLTGGDKVESGLIDVNPATMDYLVGGYLPGLINEAYKFASWSIKTAQGYDTKDAALPIVDRLTAKVPEGTNFARLRRAETFIKTKVDDYEINKEKRQEILKEFPNLGVAKSIIGAADYQLSLQRKYRNDLDNQENISDDRRVELYNRSREQEKKIVAAAVRRILETNPQMRPVLLAND